MAKSIERSVHTQYSNKPFSRRVGGSPPHSDVLPEPVYRTKIYACSRTCNIILSLIFCDLSETLKINTCFSIGYSLGFWDVSLSVLGKYLPTYRRDYFVIYLQAQAVQE